MKDLKYVKTFEQFNNTEEVNEGLFDSVSTGIKKTIEKFSDNKDELIKKIKAVFQLQLRKAGQQPKIDKINALDAAGALKILKDALQKIEAEKVSNPTINLVKDQLVVGGGAKASLGSNVMG